MFSIVTNLCKRRVELNNNNLFKLCNKSFSAVSSSIGHINEIGHDYSALLHKGRAGNKLALRDLRHLLEKIKLPEHVKYAVKGLEIYQRKGQEFSEELNSHFIKACIRGENPHAAAEMIAIRKNRIGAWSTPTSIHRLVETLLTSPNVNSDDISLVVDVLDSVSSKGINFNSKTIELVLESTKSTEKKHFQLHTKTIEAARSKLVDSNIETIESKYPTPEEPPRDIEAEKKEEARLAKIKEEIKNKKIASAKRSEEDRKKAIKALRAGKNQ